MEKTILSAAMILGVAIAISTAARLLYPEVLPILDALNIIFYLILAVTVIAVLRNMVGLITYGVFGPAIISLGLTRISDIFWGLIVFLSIVGVAVLARFILEPLKLQMTHRLALVVIVTASTMGILVFAGERSNNLLLVYAEFLPILITSWLAERFVRDRYESGVKLSLQRLAYTLVAVLLTYLLIKEPSVMNFFIYTPELWTLPVAFNLLVGYGIRIRFSERLRFKKLTDSKQDKGYSEILTVNLRNKYLEKYNPSRLRALTSKIEVKERLHKAGVSVPRTLATIGSFSDLKNLDGILARMQSEEGFVIKPNNSFGGRGIQIIRQRDGHFYMKSKGGEHLINGEVRENIEAVLDGEFSGRWLPDKILIEELVVAHPEVARLSHFGLPDIRIIVFRGVPVMAMTRLPTEKSGGRANLHQGAVGAGVSLIDGKITNAILANSSLPLTNHPDTGVNLIGVTLPFWNDILEMAVESQQIVGLGYVGVDVVIDAKRGPLVMEVNKRPGLEIQNANGKPLLRRFRAVEYFLGASSEGPMAKGVDFMRFIDSRDWMPSPDDKITWEGRP